MQHTGPQAEGGNVDEFDEYLTRIILNSLGTHELQLNRVWTKNNQERDNRPKKM